MLGLIAGLFGNKQFSPWVLKTLVFLTVLAVILYSILSLRKQGEKAAKVASQLQRIQEETRTIEVIADVQDKQRVEASAGPSTLNDLLARLQDGDAYDPATSGD